MNFVDVVCDGDEFGGFVVYWMLGYIFGYIVFVYEDYGVGFVGDQVCELNGSFGLLLGFIVIDVVENRWSVCVFVVCCLLVDVVVVGYGELVIEYGYGVFK